MAGDAVPPMLPSRAAYLLAFTAVVVGGALGAVIGWGVADLSFPGHDGAAVAGALAGAVTAVGGVGVVAVLVLRAMAEWQNQRVRDPSR